MRLEIVVPDNTSPSIKRKLSSLVKRLNSEPHLVDKIELEEPLVLTEQQKAELNTAIAQCETGLGVSAEKVFRELK